MVNGAVLTMQNNVSIRLHEWTLNSALCVFSSFFFCKMIIYLHIKTVTKTVQNSLHFLKHLCLILMFLYQSIFDNIIKTNTFKQAQKTVKWNLNQLPLFFAGLRCFVTIRKFKIRDLKKKTHHTSDFFIFLLF